MNIISIVRDICGDVEEKPKTDRDRQIEDMTSGWPLTCRINHRTVLYNLLTPVWTGDC